MNTTCLFERFSSSQTPSTYPLPHSSESFWTALFALFLLHLGKNEKSQLRVWQCKNPPDKHWYEPRRGFQGPDVGGVQFDDIAVEPPTLAGWHLDANVKVTPVTGGISPDILVRLSINNSRQKPKYLLIENKTVGADLNQRQIGNYLNLLEFLKKRKVDSELLLLMSVGTTPAMHEAAQNLQRNLRSKFGLLLWEDIFRHMKEQRFLLPGVDVGDWQKYTEALDTDADLN